MKMLGGVSDEADREARTGRALAVRSEARASKARAFLCSETISWDREMARHLYAEVSPGYIYQARRLLQRSKVTPLCV